MTVSIETCKDDIREKSLLAGFFSLIRIYRAKARSSKSGSFSSGHVVYMKGIIVI